MVVIADRSKLVAETGPLSPARGGETFGHATTAARITNALSALGYAPIPTTLRLRDGAPFKTDTGNLIYDCALGAIADAADAGPGPVGHSRRRSSTACSWALPARSSLPARTASKSSRGPDMAYDYDLFVIGGGSGGVRASRHGGA